MALSLMKSCTVGAVALLLGGLSAQSPAWADESAGPATPAVPGSSAPHGTAALQPLEAGPALSGLGTGLVQAAAPVKNLRLDPMADSSADPLSNAIALAPDSPGAKPISTTALTGPLSAGGGLGSFPLVGAATPVIPGS